MNDHDKIEDALIRAALQKKIYSLEHARNDKKHLAALSIMRDIEKDMVRLIDFVTNEIEVKRE
jgi:hypothetical protein